MSYFNFESGNDVFLHNMQHEGECTFNTPASVSASVQFK